MQNDAVLPVAARSAMRDGVPVWAVTLRWEIAKWVADGAKLAHIEEYTATQQTLKQVGFSTCGGWLTGSPRPTVAGLKARLAWIWMYASPEARSARGERVE